MWFIVLNAHYIPFRFNAVRVYLLYLSGLSEFRICLCPSCRGTCQVINVLLGNPANDFGMLSWKAAMLQGSLDCEESVKRLPFAYLNVSLGTKCQNLYDYLPFLMSSISHVYPVPRVFFFY